MDKKDEDNEIVQLITNKYDKSFSDNNIQSDIENKIKAIRDKSRTDIENIDNKDNGLRNNSQARIENKDKILNKISPNQNDDEDSISRKTETKNKLLDYLHNLLYQCNIFHFLISLFLYFLLQ